MSMETLKKSPTLLRGLELGSPMEAIEELQSAAVRLHTGAGLPNSKDEEWKYTPLRHLGEEAFVLGGATEAGSEAMPLGNLDQVRLAFVNGVYMPELSLGSANGLSITPLEEALADHDVRKAVGALANLEGRTYEVAAHLGKLSKASVGSLAALNTAAFRSGACVRIAKDAKIVPIIHLAFISTGADGPVAASFPRVLVVAEDGSDAEILESYASAGDAPAFTDAVTEVFIGANAQIEHVKLQVENSHTTHVGLTEVLQERDSTYLGFAVTFGGQTTRNDLNVFLNGAGLHCRIDGVVCVDGRQHVDNHTRLDHAYPNCDSFEVYKHVLAGHSTAVFNGKIFVHQDAQKTDAKQTNQALLLSREATMNTKPQLEIFADDVKCTHGATVGQLRQDAMFYLRSRGIGLEQARAILVYAFAAEVLEKIRHEGIRDALEAMLYAKLGVE